MTLLPSAFRWNLVRVLLAWPQRVSSFLHGASQNPHVLRRRRRRAARDPPQPRDSSSAQLHPPHSPAPSSRGPAGQGLAVPPVLPPPPRPPASLSPVPDVQEAPSQVPRRKVRADAAQASSGRGAGAARGERAGPALSEGRGAGAGWGGRPDQPGRRKVAAGGRPG